MKKLIVAPTDGFDTQCASIATDKSISHRCAMFSLLSDKTSVIENFLEAEDTLNSLQIASKLGATVEKKEGKYYITPPATIQEPDDVLDCGNAGTGIRLYSGLLSAIDGLFILTGDKYLRRRPMKRVANPLRDIGAQIDGREEGNLAPLVIRGQKLSAFIYESKIASAQVKSAMILSALFANGTSKYKEPELTRDHTERMLKGMGANISTQEGYIVIEPLQGKLKPLEFKVPSDPSSAFFFAIAAAIVPNAKIVLRDILLNPTRIEAFKVLEKMGATMRIEQTSSQYEQIGDIYVEGSELNAVKVDSNISWLIDELPALAIAMSVAKGTSRVRNAHELRVKESDRISSVVSNLQKCGIEVVEVEDGYDIVGSSFSKAVIDSCGDHRIAMSFAIAGLLCGMEIEDVECIDTSFPNFVEILSGLTKVAHAH